MTKTNIFALLFCTASMLCSCSQPLTPTPDTEDEEEKVLTLTQSQRDAWSLDNPVVGPAQFTVSHDAQKLQFFGWGLENDAKINMTFPESTEEYERAILSYKMGAWNEGPAAWDMTTQIMILDKESGEYYEIARAFTPYGNWFNSSWEKTFYIDVTEYLPMLVGDCEFRVFYSGFDATEARAHTVTMTYNLYTAQTTGNTDTPRTVYHHKLYDSRYDHNGYRGWYYGSDSLPIEDTKFLGLREFEIPEGVESLTMKVSISGHGMEQGVFPDRIGYRTRNAAEFDENTYQVIVNGTNMGSGHVFYDNSDTYRQAGTYSLDRANWGPGLPLNTHFWQITNLPEDGKMSIDLDLDRYISPAKLGAAYYIVQVDVFGMDK